MPRNAAEELTIMKGGHPNSGPQPDPNALRRERDLGEWTLLPAEGRPGEPLEWPLTAATDREVELWARMWAKPQAMMWERDDQAFEVALYVRLLAVVEQPGSSTAAGTLLRQQSEALGLTTPGLNRNRWRIIRDQVAEKRVQQEQQEATPAARPAARSSKSRLTVVAHGDVAV